MARVGIKKVKLFFFGAHPIPYMATVRSIWYRGETVKYGDPDRTVYTQLTIR